MSSASALMIEGREPGLSCLRFFLPVPGAFASCPLVRRFWAQPAAHFEDREAGLSWCHMRKDRRLKEVSLWATCLRHGVKNYVQELQLSSVTLWSLGSVCWEQPSFESGPH